MNRPAFYRIESLESTSGITQPVPPPSKLGVSYKYVNMKSISDNG